MRKIHIFLLIGIFTTAILSSCSQNNDSKFPKLQGPYLGQTPPSDTAEIFAPNIISTNLNEGMISFNSDGTEAYFSAGIDQPNRAYFYFYSTIKNGTWTEPVEFPMKRGIFFRPVLNPQGNRVYCVSSRAELSVEGEPNLIKIYYFEKYKDVWSNHNVIDFGDDFPYDAGHLSVAENGNIYFQTGYRIYGNEDIYLSQYKDGKYLTPIKLSDAINTSEHELHPYIAPDESFLIFDANREEGFGNNDLYISFKDENGNWTKAVNMGPKVNSERDERRSYVTTDGKYIFYESHLTDRGAHLPDAPITLNQFKEYTSSYKNGSANLYWLNAKVIEDLKPDRLK